MNKAINLLIPEEHNTQLLQRIKMLRLVSLSFLFLIVVSAISLFFLIMSSPLPALRQQENAARENMSRYKSKAARLFLIRDRLGKIEAIINTRPTLNRMIERIEEELPQGVTVERIRTTGDSFSVTVSASSLQSIQTFVANMKVLKEQRLFTSLALSSLLFSEEEPKYVITVSSTL